MIQAVVFDFFGVICTDIYWAWLRGHVPDLDERKERLQALSDQVDRGEITRSEFLRRVSTETGYAPDEIQTEIGAQVKLDVELLRIIRRLKGDYRLGLLSNASIEGLRPILARYDLEGLFDEIVISSEVGLIKPDPAIFELTLERLGVKPDETIFIDDRPVHVRAAEALGIHAIHFTSREALERELAVELRG